MSISEKIADFLTQTNYDDIPGKVIDFTKERVLDIIGVCIAGSYNWEYTNNIINSVYNLATGSSTVIGHKEKLSCPYAAMVNAAYGHSLELDDGHRNAGVHAGAVIIPTALSVAELLHSPGKEVILSIILGYDIVYRIARAVNPAQIKKGFHPSAACGSIGAAVTTSKLLGLNKKQTSAAMNLSLIQTSGTMEATISGQASKSIMVGHAALIGIVSAWMSKEGIIGPKEAFEGKYGFFNNMSSNVNQNSVFKEIGRQFEILDTYTKLYPTCRHIHPVIEGILLLKNKYKFSINDIEEVIVGTHQVAINIAGNIYFPKNSREASFSIPYITAIALKENFVELKHLESIFLNDNRIQNLAKLVKLNVDDEINKIFPKQRGAKVEILFKNGKKIKKTLYVLKGSPELPASKEVINKKFASCVSSVLSTESYSEMIRLIDGLDSLEDITFFMKFLSKVD